MASSGSAAPSLPSSSAAGSNETSRRGQLATGVGRSAIALVESLPEIPVTQVLGNQENPLATRKAGSLLLWYLGSAGQG